MQKIGCYKEEETTNIFRPGKKRGPHRHFPKKTLVESPKVEAAEEERPGHVIEEEADGT